LKAHGVQLDSIKDKATGQLTPDGESILMDLFALASDAEQPVEKVDTTEVEKLRNQVEKLSTEVEKLRNQVETLEDERNYLRGALEREQQLTGMTISKLPAPPPALPPTEAERGRLRTWWDRIRGRA
jgi:predicted  nucleic acid-binding Zn-ribbon protein